MEQVGSWAQPCDDDTVSDESQSMRIGPLAFVLTRLFAAHYHELALNGHDC